MATREQPPAGPGCTRCHELGRILIVDPHGNYEETCPDCGADIRRAEDARRQQEAERIRAIEAAREEIIAAARAWCDTWFAEVAMQELYDAGYALKDAVAWLESLEATGGDDAHG